MAINNSDVKLFESQRLTDEEDGAKRVQEAIKNITSALRISEQIYNERILQANNEKAQALQESQVITSAPATQTVQQSPQKIIRLEYPGGAVNVGIDSTDETKLLEVLKNAGMRTLYKEKAMQLNTLTLPDDLLWINEFEWNPVEQTTERSLTGALLVQEGQLTHGRPIVLSGNGEAGWVSLLTVKNLVALSKADNKTMTLTLPDSGQFSVIFDRSNGAPVEAQQVLPFAYPEDSDQYLLTLRLLTVYSG